MTIEDLEHYIEDIERNKITPASSMRKAVADAMVRSWSRPLATVVLPIRMDALLKHRRAQTVKAGPALYALRALSMALGENSTVAGRLVGERIVHPRSVDIGFAVEAEDGVLVPVIRNADQFPPRRTRRALQPPRRTRPPTPPPGRRHRRLHRDRDELRCLRPDHRHADPLPEQTLLLGMGAGQTIPSWNAKEGKFEPVIEAAFTLSFDHRVLDGGAAGRLLQRVSTLLNDPESL